MPETPVDSCSSLVRPNFNLSQSLNFETGTNAVNHFVDTEIQSNVYTSQSPSKIIDRCNNEIHSDLIASTPNHDLALANKPKTKNVPRQQESTSVGEKKVLIIEPIEDLTDEQRPVKKIFSNDLALARSIYKSIICKASIDNISININRKLVDVEFKPDKTNKIFFLAFLKLANIGQWKVSCRLP